MTDDPLVPLATALAAVDRLVAAVGPGDWDRPTPCGDWTARQLAGHLVGGNRLAARVLRGEPLPPMDQLGRRDPAGQLGDDPVEACRTSGEELLAALRQPGVLERPHTLPAGTLPGPAVVHLRTVEALVHGWDLARATGRPLDVPDALVEPEIGFSRGLLGRLPEGRSPFGPPQPVADDAAALDRLVALLGRSPGWEPSSHSNV